MKKLQIFCFILLILSSSIFAQNFDSNSIFKSIKTSGIDSTAFNYAMKGLKKWDTKIKNNKILTVIDFSKSSLKKRLYVIDLKNKKVVFQEYCSHGIGSGGNIPDKFSNLEGSNMSSLGFYLTGFACNFSSKHGFAMMLEGLEPNINDNAKKREIIVHKSGFVGKIPYCSEEFIKKYGNLGRSNGCPVLPLESYKEIINSIKDGSLMFIYSKKGDYFKKTSVK